MHQTAEFAPKLAEPGAGLPPLEWAIAKFVLMPWRFASVNPAQSLKGFMEESKKIEDLCSKLSLAQMSERRLIARVRGLEDSSRFWSVAMVLEHLIIVGSQMQNIIRSLSTGKSVEGKASTKAVKPDPNVSVNNIAERFHDMTQDFEATIEQLDPTFYPRLTFAHPWFGELNAKQWLAFAAPHQAIHRMQIERIVALL